MTAKRQQARRAELRAETVAAWWLRLKGYRVTDRNLRTPLGEIDIIARRGETVAIVEVKQRPDAATGSTAVSVHQQKRLINAARWLISARPALAALTIRFDVILVTPRRFPLHIRDAWRENR